MCSSDLFKPLNCSFLIKKTRKTKGKYASLLSDIIHEVMNIRQAIVMEKSFFSIVIFTNKAINKKLQALVTTSPLAEALTNNDEGNKARAAKRLFLMDKIFNAA